MVSCVRRIACMGIAERIAQVMTERGFNPSSLSRELGNEPGRMAISAWCKGDTSPQSDDLIRLADVLGVDPAWLLTGERPELTEDEQLVLRAYRKARSYGVEPDDVIMLIGGAIERLAPASDAATPGTNRRLPQPGDHAPLDFPTRSKSTRSGSA